MGDTDRGHLLNLATVTLQEEYDELREGFEKGFVKFPPGTTNCGEDVSGMWALAMCVPREICSLFCRRLMWLERELNRKLPSI